MSDESDVRSKVREAMQAGSLPDRSPDKVWGGPGTGSHCALCGAAIRQEETELEIEFGRLGRPPKSFIVHLRCFSLLEEERQRGAGGPVRALGDARPNESRH